MCDNDNYSVESRNIDYAEIKTNRMIKYAKENFSKRQYTEIMTDRKICLKHSYHSYLG